MIQGTNTRLGHRYGRPLSCSEYRTPCTRQVRSGLVLQRVPHSVYQSVALMSLQVSECLNVDIVSMVGVGEIHGDDTGD
ncbi:hypothetical protein J6590_067056 [Homalodisca vitripennis]|nr:hypothetical protein J6590_067056 [Homalodisca vitripennis]